MSLEHQVNKLLALKQPIPTLLKRPESTEESLMGGGPTDNFCGVVVPTRYRFLVGEIYQEIVDWMYCRPHPIPGGGCAQLSLGPPLGDGSLPAHQWVTDRDKPLSWQRIHPDFNPDDPATWGSLFGPNGFAADRFTFWIRYTTPENYGVHDGPFIHPWNQEDLDAMIELVRQLYIARCSFAVAQTGACCKIAGEFGGFTCVPTTGSECGDGTFYPGKSCGDIDDDNCGLARNPIQESDQVKRPKEILDMVMSSLKRS
jgi:hypothetical protein